MAAQRRPYNYQQIADTSNGPGRSLVRTMARQGVGDLLDFASTVPSAVGIPTPAFSGGTELYPISPLSNVPLSATMVGPQVVDNTPWGLILLGGLMLMLLTSGSSPSRYGR